jgi:hypothetical protein
LSSGVFHLATVWPLFLLLYYTGVETIDWTLVPWIDIIAASAFAIGQLSIILQACYSWLQMQQSLLLLLLLYCMRPAGLNANFNRFATLLSL